MKITSLTSKPIKYGDAIEARVAHNRQKEAIDEVYIGATETILQKRDNINISDFLEHYKFATEI